MTHPHGRRSFLISAAALGLAACARPVAKPPAQRGSLEEVSLADISAGLNNSKWTSVQLVETYQQRVQEIDAAGPTLRSILVMNPEALDYARRLDAERREGRLRGVLHGVPILVKDNIATAGPMATTAGSQALNGWHSPTDAFVIKQLRAAGAVILGKTNLSEWANFRSLRSSSGWSAVGGQTRNPYALDRNPSGSSSGSGVAVSANLCAAALGTETDGSIVSPASINGIVGLKPTVGLVSRSGIIPISHSQDTAGPMTRTVRDAALLLDALVGEDAADAATQAQRGQPVGSYAAALNATALRGSRLGLVRSFVPNHPAVDKLLEECVRVLKDRGATVVDITLDDGGKLSAAAFEVLLYEFKTDLEQFLATLPADRPRTLAALIEFNRQHAATEMRWFGQEIFELAVKKGPLSDVAYRDARMTCLRTTREEGIDAVMKQHSLSALVGITDSPAWPTDWINGDHFSGGASTWAAVAGYPHVTVPAGFVHGLPVGFSFFGRAWGERELLRLAGAFEEATKARRTPQFLASVKP